MSYALCLSFHITGTKCMTQATKGSKGLLWISLMLQCIMVGDGLAQVLRGSTPVFIQFPEV